MQCPICKAAIQFPPFGSETGVVCWYCKARLIVKIEVNTGEKSMTVKMQCVKIERIWGGTAVYHFTSIDKPHASFVITLSEEDPRRFNLGGNYEIGIQ